MAISIHALHEESDLTFDHYYPVTIPISIHALHEESDLQLLQWVEVKHISIHALHEESDDPADQLRDGGHISIHALHEESDLGLPTVRFSSIFQSTLSMRRATRL